MLAALYALVSMTCFVGGGGVLFGLHQFEKDAGGPLDSTPYIPFAILAIGVGFAVAAVLMSRRERPKG